MKVSKLVIFLCFTLMTASCSTVKMQEGGIGGTGSKQQCSDDEKDRESGECVDKN